MSSNRSKSVEETVFITESSRNYTSENHESIKKYVQEFKKEVELKFNQSETNKKFKFPRKKKTVKKKYSAEKDQSFNSLQHVQLYDLEAINVKRTIIDKNEEFGNNNAKYLSFVINQLGKLHVDYLESQFQTEKSELFNILLKAVLVIKNKYSENFFNKAKKTKNKVFKFQKKLNRKSIKGISSKKINKSIKKNEEAFSQNKSKEHLLKKKSNELINKEKSKEFVNNEKSKDLIYREKSKDLISKHKIKETTIKPNSKEMILKKKSNDRMQKQLSQINFLKKDKELEPKPKSNEINSNKIKYILKNKEIYLNFDTKKINSNNNNNNNNKIISNYTPHTSRASMLKNNKNVKSSSITRKKSQNESKKCLLKKSMKNENNVIIHSKLKITETTGRNQNKNQSQSILDSSLISKKNKKLDFGNKKKLSPLTFTKDQLNSLISKNFNRKNSNKKYIEINHPYKESSSKKKILNDKNKNINSFRYK